LALSTGLSQPTINAALEQLTWSGIVDEITGRKRGRVFAYQAYLDILNEGTTPPAL
jgi:Fic family protein